MIADLDTLLTALYVELTDRIIPLRGPGRRGPGRPPDVTDAELACLAVAQVLLADRRPRQAIPDRLRPRVTCPHFPINDLERARCSIRYRIAGVVGNKAAMIDGSLPR